jgi:Fe-S cluster assembly iron-binding protein IscA
MALALDEPKETDMTHEYDGITYLLDKGLFDKVGDVSVDFVEKGWSAGFVISTKNPIGFGASNCGSGCSC